MDKAEDMLSEDTDVDRASDPGVSPPHLSTCGLGAGEVSPRYEVLGGSGPTYPPAPGSVSAALWCGLLEGPVCHAVSGEVAGRAGAFCPVRNVRALEAPQMIWDSVVLWRKFLFHAVGWVLILYLLQENRQSQANAPVYQQNGMSPFTAVPASQTCIWRSHVCHCPFSASSRHLIRAPHWAYCKGFWPSHWGGRCWSVWWACPHLGTAALSEEPCLVWVGTERGVDSLPCWSPSQHYHLTDVLQVTLERSPCWGDVWELLMPVRGPWAGCTSSPLVWDEFLKSPFDRSDIGGEGSPTHSHQLFLSCLLVLHTGKRWFIICPVAEHPAVEAPESSPPLPLSSLQPDTSQGMSSQNSQPFLLDNSVCLLCIAPHHLMVLSLTWLVPMFCQHVLCAKQSARAPPCTVAPKPRAVCGAVSLSVPLSQLSTK